MGARRGIEKRKRLAASIERWRWAEREVCAGIRRFQRALLKHLGRLRLIRQRLGKLEAGR